MTRSRFRRRPVRPGGRSRTARRRRAAGRSRSGSPRSVVWLAVVAVAFALLNWLRERPAVAIGLAAVVIACAVAAAALFVLAVRLRRQREEALTRSVASTDSLTGAEFERWLATLMRRTGFTEVQICGGAGDLGADITARTPNGRRLVVQCKRYRQGRSVGSPDVQKLAGTAAAVHDADVAAIVTTSLYTRPARTLAEQLGIKLIDRPSLARWAADGVPPLALAHRTAPAAAHHPLSAPRPAPTATYEPG